MSGTGNAPRGPNQPGNEQYQGQDGQVGAAALPPGGPVGEQIKHRVRLGLFGAVKDLRFVSERPASLLEHIAYARSGEWTQEIDGYWRTLALLYAYAVAVPLSTVAYLVAWAGARPGRLFSGVGVTLLVTTGLAAIPVVGWFIPRWLTLLAWPPFSWIF